MKIKPSTALRNEYNEIASYCRESQQPVYITKNGEGDMVVMSIEQYARREELLDLREKLLDAEAKALRGGKIYTAEEVNKRLKEIIDESI